MKKTTLGAIPDGQVFKRREKSKVTFTLIKREGESFVYTSNSSNKSYTRTRYCPVFINQ
jgi:hypothetical protein